MHIRSIKASTWVDWVWAVTLTTPTMVSSKPRVTDSSWLFQVRSMYLAYDGIALMNALVWLNHASILSFVSTVLRERIVAAGAA